MSEKREILNEAEVDFLMAGAAAEVATTAPSLDDGNATITMHGDLDQISLADIFQTLAIAKMEGVLRVRNPLEERQVYCHNGSVRILVPPRLKLRRLGQRLIQAGLLHSDKLRVALQLQKKQKLPLGQLLVREGMITQAQLDTIIGMQVAEDLFALFTWKHGTFEFFKGDPANPALRSQFESCPEYEVNSLLLEVARRTDEWESILAAIGCLDEIPTQIAEPASPEELQESHQLVLAGVNGTSTYRQLSDQTTLGLFEFARAARDLVQGEILAAIDDSALVTAATNLVDEGDVKRAVVLLQTLRDRPGDRSAPIITGMAQVLERIGERRFASSLLLEAAQRSPDPAAALELARTARDLVPYDPGTLSFLRTVLVAHGEAGSAELEKCTIDLLDALIDGDLASTALEIVEDARRTETLTTPMMMREARARQKARDIEGACQVLFELAARYQAEKNRDKAVETYEALLRLDRTRRDVQKLLAQLRRTRIGSIVRLSAILLVTFLVGGAGTVWWQQRAFENSVQQATADLDALLAQGERDQARQRLDHWRNELGPCEAIQDLASRLAFADSAELNRVERLRRARTNEQLLAAAEALGRGDLQQAMQLYTQSSSEAGMAAEVQEVVATRMQALLEELQRTAQALDANMPAEPTVLFDRKQLAENLAVLQRLCPPTLLRAYEQLASVVGSEGLPAFVAAEQRDHARRVVEQARSNLLRAGQLAEIYTEAIRQNDTQHRLDPLFKSAVDKEAKNDFAGALVLYRELEGQPTGDAELRRHFRDRVTRNATIVRLLEALATATEAGDFGTAQQHLRALRLSFPEVPFDQLVRLPLLLDSQPSGATVTCNGEPIGNTPLLLARVPAEETRLTVSMPGFEGAKRMLIGDGVASWTASLTLIATWTWQHDSAIELPPIVTTDGGLVFVDRGGNVLRRPADLGSTIWRFESGDLSGWLSHPLIDGTQLIVASLDGELRSLASADGKLAWSLSNLPCDVTPVLVGRTIAMATTDHRLHAIDLEEKRRRSADLPEAAHGSLLTTGERVFACGERGLISCWKMPDLQPVWQRQIPEIASPNAAIAGNRIVIADDHGNVFGVDLNTGEVAWRRSLNVATLGRMAHGLDTIWLTTPERILRINAQTGEDLTSFTHEAEDLAGEVTISGKRLLVPLRSEQVLVLDAETGHSLYRLAGAKRCRVLAVGERVLVTGAGHRVIGYDSLR